MSIIDNLALLIQRGGFVMVPLLGLSVVSLSLVIERAVFWTTVNGSAAVRRLRGINAALRRGDVAGVRKLIRGDASPYARVARRLLDEGASDAVALETVEMQRPRLDRFMVSLSTIITAAPLLGILGTVIGIIRSFDLMGEQGARTDLGAVSSGIAEALLTTALGLVVALVTLLPYMIYRGYAQRALGHLESVIAAAQEGLPGPRAATVSPPDEAAPRDEPGNRRRAARVAGERERTKGHAS